VNTFDNPWQPLGPITLTIKTAYAPAVHVTYEPKRPIAHSAVTILDQAGATRGWSFEDVVKDAYAFLVLYIVDPAKWPAELRAPCAGRAQADEAS
jgi:hypothetical protein